MRIDEGKLRAYLDQALLPHELDTIKKQLVDDPQAQTALAELHRERVQAADHLAIMSPPQTAQSKAQQALSRLQRHIAQESTHSTDKRLIKVKERLNTMFSYSFIKRHQPAFIALTLVAVIAVLFSFAPVRAMAANFLTVFRVQQVKVVRVNVNRIDDYENDDELKGLLDQLDTEPDKVSGGGDPQEVGSMEDAAGSVDFQVANIGALPDDAGELRKILVHKAAVYQLNLDKDLLEAIFDAADIELELPDSLDEQPLVITKPAGISQEWGSDENGKALSFAQFGSPQVDHPEDLDLKAFGIAVLQFLGKSKDEARELGQSIDWANTLLLPIPNDDDVKASEVSINGSNGVLFTKPNSQKAGVMWQKSGMTYMLDGKYNAEQILEIARSVN